MSNRKQPTVFLTGATGAIGSRILEHYLLHGSEVLVVARERDGLSAEDRIQALLEEAELPRNLRRKVAVLEGSITEPRFGFSRAEYGRVVKAAEIFIHSAAVTNLGASAEECERAN